MANNLVKRVLMDNDSSVDIIFKTTLERIKLGALRRITIQTPLYGFTRKRVMTEGTINLPYTVGTPWGIKILHMVPFLVVDQPSSYNVIIVRTTLNKLLMPKNGSTMKTRVDRSSVRPYGGTKVQIGANPFNSKLRVRGLVLVPKSLLQL